MRGRSDAKKHTKMTTENKDNIELKPCPFCGEDPELSTEGACIEIDCCVSMSRQKSDYLDIHERLQYDNVEHKFTDEVEKKVLDIVLKEWNTRHG